MGNDRHADLIQSIQDGCVLKPAGERKPTKKFAENQKVGGKSFLEQARDTMNEIQGRRPFIQYSSSESSSDDEWKD